MSAQELAFESSDTPAAPDHVDEDYMWGCWLEQQQAEEDYLSQNPDERIY